MSLEFNRRSFLKYTAAAAVVVAGSSLLTGCGESYAKTGTIGSKLTLMGEHTLLDGTGNAPTVANAASNTAGAYDITCKLTHKCTTSKVPLCIDEGCYELTVYNSGKKDDEAVDYTTNHMELDPKKYDLQEENGEQTFTLTIKDVKLTDGQYVDLKYWPRKVASTGERSYVSVYCTWQMQAKLEGNDMTLVKR